MNLSNFYYCFIFSFLFLTGISQAEVPVQIDENQISISGVSSGAYMAIQMQVAHSKLIRAAASIAGGVYWCAQGSSLKAQLDCMRKPQGDEPEIYIKKAQEYEKAGLIDPLENLKERRVMVVSSAGDRVTHSLNSNRLFNFLRNLTSEDNLKHFHHEKAGHGFLTLDYGQECDKGQSPWLLKCNVDLARELLSFLKGPLLAKTLARPESLMRFSQVPFQTQKSHIADFGWIYIPQECLQGGKCGLHLALHGCQMSFEFIQDQFVKHAGFNDWAENHQLIILYPQIKKSPQNPQGCWDWYGYTGPDYSQKAGLQIEALYQMIMNVQKLNFLKE